MDKKKTTTDDGLKFGLGFWLAFTLYSIIVWPTIACVVWIILTFMGMSGY